MLKDRRTRFVCVLAFVAMIAWAGVLLPTRKSLEVTFLDVGDGLCTILRTPSGRTMVMDCGTSSWRNPGSVGRTLAAPYLQSMGLDSVDVVVLSHPHSDHESGMPSLMKLEPARLALDIHARLHSHEYKEFIAAVKTCHAKYRIAHRGQVLDLGDGVKAQILNPPPNADAEDLNDESMVLRVTYKRAAILLDADAGDTAEDDILNSRADVRAQVLQVGHHGSNTATSARWLSEVRPKIAIISCARHSRYHFPSWQVLGRLAACGARTYVTGRCGAVTISTDGEKIRVDTFRRFR